MLSVPFTFYSSGATAADAIVSKQSTGWADTIFMTQQIGQTHEWDSLVTYPLSLGKEEVKELNTISISSCLWFFPCEAI